MANLRGCLFYTEMKSVLKIRFCKYLSNHVMRLLVSWLILASFKRKWIRTAKYSSLIFEQKIQLNNKEQEQNDSLTLQQKRAMVRKHELRLLLH